jgi:small subunit ribosomal protein S3
MRVGIMKSWPCEWFAKDKKSQSDFVVEDIRILEYFDKHYLHAGVAKVVIRKTATEVETIIFTSKVGVMMGKNGEKIKELEDILKKKFAKEFKVTLKEVKVPEFSAKIMAEFITQQLENRMPFRKVAKTVLKKVMDK